MPASVHLAASQPIGIFDSGIGGLTVARAIRQKLPKEKLIYFGDTAHFPYGDKSPDSIKYYAIRIAQFMLDNHCKMIVIACNTASALAYDTVKDFVGKSALVVNVVEPVVKKVLEKKSRYRNVGVIATKGTVKSDIYARKIKEADKGITVNSLATPLLASMIEEGFFNNKISRSIINSYLERPRLKKINALILGCTHYPLIKPEIEEFYKGEVPLIDSSDAVAEFVYQTLKKQKLLNTSSKPVHKFYISDYTKAFEKSAHFFFGGKISLEEARIWK